MSQGRSDLFLPQISKEVLCNSSLFYFLVLACFSSSSDRLLLGEDSICLILLSLTKIDCSVSYMVDS